MSNSLRTGTTLGPCRSVALQAPDGEALGRLIREEG
jgi:hypothetical protein